jgi:hypothetical protein
MRVIKINVYVETNRIGSRNEAEFEVWVDDDATPEEEEKELEAAAREWMFDNIEWNYERQEGNKI